MKNTAEIAGIAAMLCLAPSLIHALAAHEMPGMTQPTGSQPSTHDHTLLEIPAGQPVPTVQLKLVPDAMKGWNLEVITTNFRFAPEHINTKNLPGEGHAHLYVNGKKVTRLYGAWYYLASLPAGKNTITVSLNSNKHEQLAYQGKPIQTTTLLTVP